MSIQDITHFIMEFIKNNQMWALPIIFFLAFGESLALISLLVPASAILIAIGALVGADLLPFFPVWLAATSGAIVGDWLSYWLGKHFHEKIIHSWPLNKHPKAVYKAEQFFHHYGLGGVFIGRFFGPLRAIVPLVAGAMHMPSLKFNIANISSAPVWAFIVLAPGTFGFHVLAKLFS